MFQGVDFLFVQFEFEPVQPFLQLVFFTLTCPSQWVLVAVDYIDNPISTRWTVGDSDIKHVLLALRYGWESEPDVRLIYTITTHIRFTLKYRIGIIRIILIPLVQPFGVQHFAFCVVSRWDVRIICIPRIVSIISGITVVIRFCTTIK
ncbi:hypothetical protein B9H04_09340 [Halorubrum ezzemoulense DSM 17463]|uniref:Uncharacterized protein n=1 Tax=Halorubrum ezzemoulense DSM 17463 TaxID=1121945 RepID=A0A1X4H2N6_HALEZ|nr:hypothetical protein B9H04_09340 [Halorubrum ezzemoulense DSM 17463]